MERAVLRQAFDGGDFAAISLDGKERAGFDGLAVEQDRAGAAAGGCATYVRAGGLEMIAKKMNRQQGRFDCVLVLHSVDSDFDERFHKDLSEKNWNHEIHEIHKKVGRGRA